MEPAAELIVNAARGDGLQPGDGGRDEVRMAKESVREDRLGRRKIVKARTLTLPLRLCFECLPRALQNASTECIKRARFRAACHFSGANLRREFVRQHVESGIFLIGLAHRAEHPEHPAMLFAIWRQVARDQQRGAIRL